LQHGGYKSGYVLKSHFLRGEQYDLKGERKITFTIMSGYHLPKKIGDTKDIVDPYVVVKLYTTAAPS
jgi:hypothetical protein